jgi:nitrate reductase NapD
MTKPATAAVDRRAFITGRVITADRVVPPPEGEIASILVQARPEHLDEVEATIAALDYCIAALDYCEIHARDAKGKLVVVIDAPQSGAIGSTLNTIALLPHVYSASLVFHAIDTGDA